MRSRTDWLEAGLTELALAGPPGLRLEVLCRAMNATRGSFYHHFSDIGAFRRELATYFEQTGTTRYVEEAEAAAEQGALGQFKAFRQAVYSEGITEQELLRERAFRAWATQEPFVAEIVQRMDSRRVGYLTELMQRADVPDAHNRASIVYLILIGGLYLAPPLTPDRIRELADTVMADLVRDLPE